MDRGELSLSLSENNGPADQFSRNFGSPDQNFRRTKISVTVRVFADLTRVHNNDGGVRAYCNVVLVGLYPGGGEDR